MIRFSEVDKFDVEVVVGYDIVRFEIEVDNVEISEIPKTLANRKHQAEFGVETQKCRVVLDNISQCFVGDILNEQAARQEAALLDVVGGEVVLRQIDRSALLHLLDYLELVLFSAVLASLALEDLDVGLFSFDYHSLSEQVVLSLGVGAAAISLVNVPEVYLS